MWCLQVGLPLLDCCKKYDQVRQISDLCSLNKCTQWKQYLMPVIHDIMYQILGYKYIIKLDISMQYHTFEPNDESQELHVIITPFGKHKYMHLPIIPLILYNNSWIRSYVDFTMLNYTLMTLLSQLGKTSNKVLSCLEASGFTINPLKCEWAVQETNFL